MATQKTPPTPDGFGQMGSMPNKPKKRKFKWLYILIAIFVFGGIVSTCSDDEESKNKVKSETNSNQSPAASNEEESSIDSVRAKELEPLFSKSYDEFTKTEWVTPKSAPKYRNQNGMYAYFAIVDGKPQNMRLVGQYYADDWLFIKECVLLVNGETYSFKPKTKRDNASGKIWEWFDEPVNREDIYVPFAKIVTEGKNGNVKVRFIGRQYQEDRELSAKEIKGIKDAFDYYIALGGK